MEVDDLQTSTGDSDDVVGAIIGEVVALSLLVLSIFMFCRKMNRKNCGFVFRL